MKTVFHIASTLLLMLVLAGCGSSKITMQQTYEGEKIPRPDRIVVYDFASNAADLPAWSTAHHKFKDQVSDGTETEEQRQAARDLGVQLAREVVEKIREMGLTGVTYRPETAAQPGDVILIGYFVGIEEGSAGKRVMIGFGSGASDLETQMEAYLMTASGPRKLAAGGTDASGGKSPGLLLPIAVVAATGNPIGLIVGGTMQAHGALTGKNTIQGIAKETAEDIGEQLEKGFKRQGWI